MSVASSIRDCADEVRPQLARQIAPCQPFALEVMTNFRPVGIDRAAAAGEATTHLGPGGFLLGSISSAEQHIVQAPQDFPNAAVIRSSRRRLIRSSRRLAISYHYFSPEETGGFRKSEVVGAIAGRKPFVRRWEPMAAPRVVWQLSKEAVMDKEHIKGAADKAKGAMKDAAGKMMDDKELQAEGKMDKAKGSAREALGDAKDAVRHANDK